MIFSLSTILLKPPLHKNPSFEKEGHLQEARLIALFQLYLLQFVYDLR